MYKLIYSDGKQISGCGEERRWYPQGEDGRISKVAQEKLWGQWLVHSSDCGDGFMVVCMCIPTSTFEIWAVYSCQLYVNKATKK